MIFLLSPILWWHYRKPFFLASGQTINVDMMYNGGHFPFYEDKQLGVKILGLPYKNGEGNTVGDCNYLKIIYINNKATIYYRKIDCR